jgi:hypothetical protein
VINWLRRHEEDAAEDNIFWLLCDGILSLSRATKVGDALTFEVEAVEQAKTRSVKAISRRFETDRSGLSVVFRSIGLLRPDRSRKIPPNQLQIQVFFSIDLESIGNRECREVL